MTVQITKSQATESEVSTPLTQSCHWGRYKARHIHHQSAHYIFITSTLARLGLFAGLPPVTDQQKVSPPKFGIHILFPKFDLHSNERTTESRVTAFDVHYLTGLTEG